MLKSAARTNEHACLLAMRVCILERVPAAALSAASGSFSARASRNFTCMLHVRVSRAGLPSSRSRARGASGRRDDAYSFRDLAISPDLAITSDRARRSYTANARAGGARAVGARAVGEGTESPEVPEAPKAKLLLRLL